MTEARIRNKPDTNPQLDQAEGDWNVRNQRDVVNFRIRDRLSLRNQDVQVCYTSDKYPNVKNINILPLPSLTRYLSNVIKTSNGYLKKITIFRDKYLFGSALTEFRLQTIAKLPVTTFEDVEDLSRLLASHFVQDKTVVAIEADAETKVVRIYTGLLDTTQTYRETKRVIEEEVEVEVEVEEEAEGKAKPSKKKQKVKQMVCREVTEREEDLDPMIVLNFFRAR